MVPLWLLLQLIQPLQQSLMLSLLLLILEQPLGHNSTFTVVFKIPYLAVSFKLTLAQQFLGQILELGGPHVVGEDPTLVVLAKGCRVVIAYLAESPLEEIQSSGMKKLHVFVVEEIIGFGRDFQKLIKESSILATVVELSQIPGLLD